MRPKRRYIAFEVVGTEMGKNAVIKTLELAFGKTTVSDFDKGLLKLVIYNPESKFGLLRCGHKEVEAIRAIITQDGIDDKISSFKIMGVSGTIKAARRKFLAHSQAKVK